MDVEDFIARWTSREGGAERANYQMFLSELCDVIGVARPDMAGADRTRNDYVFERAVKTRESEGRNATLRIDLYKKGAFILEAKQSRTREGGKVAPGQLSLLEDEPTASTGAAPAGWDVMMRNARRQAEDYVFRLDADHPAPPFIIVCDVGRCLELYADFTGGGRAYNQFPDRKRFRVSMADLRDPAVRELLAKVWTDPKALDPTRESARVTRGIAARLAEVSKALEANHPAEDVAHFLMRCIFTMFAEDVDLLPKGKFTDMLNDCIDSPGSFAPLLEDLWSKMDEPDEARRFFSGFAARLRYFNGNLFKGAKAYPLPRELIGELAAAAKAKWTEVDPAIFGTLLEQALDPAERRQLGAHYTPRSYVQRLVGVTVMEPLRADWTRAQEQAQQASADGKPADAIRLVRAFHHQLCATRVLDPACGTGNFLYVSLEMMKQLEGEVIQALSDLGDNQASLVMQGETIDPHQFLGLELNPRAAAIAELVVWIGYLQWHYRNYASHPAEPILRAFKNIKQMDAVLTWDGYPTPKVEVKDGVAVETYPNARRPDWPEAEFIVGNPPFIGNKRLRNRLGTPYVEALRKAQKGIPNSVDFVMYWFGRMSELLKRKKIRRFGIVTTNSIIQPLNRTPIQHLLSDSDGGAASIIYCIPDHPWVDPGEGAAVRIAMVVAERGTKEGILNLVAAEASEPLEYEERQGVINSVLMIGNDLSRVTSLLANKSISQQGIILAGEGFRISPDERETIVGKYPEYTRILKRYMIGNDLTGKPKERYVIDVNRYSLDEIRREFPEAFQLLKERVEPDRSLNNDRSFREKWWRWARPRPEISDMNEGRLRYIGTCRTAVHRSFSFLPVDIVPDAKIVAIGLDDGASLAILNSKIHKIWALKTGGFVEDRPTYQHADCFGKFPFPELNASASQKLNDLGEELDAVRTRALAANPEFTLTLIYNTLAKVGREVELDPQERELFSKGLVLVIKEIHEQIDAATADAYGWPRDLSDEQILERLVALNAERAREEAAGQVRWLRPDYQIPRFAKGAAARSGELDLGEAAAPAAAGGELQDFPKDPYEQASAALAALAAADTPLTPAELARAFKRGGKRIEQRLTQILAAQARYGQAAALPDGRFAVRRAA